MTSCKALLLPFFKKHILEIIYLIQLKMMFFVKKLLLFVHSYFCNTFFKMYCKNILKLYLVGMLVDLNNLGVLEVFIFAIYLKRHLRIFRSKHESLHPPWCYVHLSISSTASLTHSQKSDVLKIGLFNLNYFWTFQIRKESGITILGAEVVKYYFFHFFKNIFLKLFI